MARVPKNVLESAPPLFDIYVRLRSALGKKRASHDFFDGFSRQLSKQVTFVQIGANDGLRNDPIREFVVRDRWSGILVEPLPHVFEQLKKNYAYLRNHGLRYENAAISSDGAAQVTLWTFRGSFLSGLSETQRMRYLRKSSFDPEHVRKFVPPDRRFEEIVESVSIPCWTVTQNIRRHGLEGKVDLVVIDVEGHESVIIQAIDFDVVRPKAIFFEIEHLGSRKKDLYAFLTANGYRVREIRTDAVAVRE